MTQKIEHINSVLLLGYFGYGNLGDDILCKVGYNLAKQYFPDAKISVINYPKVDYLSSLLSEEIETIQSTYNKQFDLIIHAGGGVFFDFNSGGFKYRMLNVIGGILGQKVANKLHNIVLRLKKQNFEYSKYRIGLGIGIGSFTKDSSKMILAKRRLSDMHMLFVRDNKSLSNLKLLTKSSQGNVASDLAFFSDYWLDKPVRSESSEKSIAIILRDWESSDYVMRQIRTIESLKDNGYDLNYYSFYPTHDQNYIDILESQGLAVHKWLPSKHSINEFVGHIAQNNMVVSSRAHGAIISSITGIMSVLIEIEPKLKAINNILSSSSALVGHDFTIEELLNAITSQQKCDAKLCTDKDLKSNNSLNDKILLGLRGLADLNH